MIHSNPPGPSFNTRFLERAKNPLLLLPGEAQSHKSLEKLNTAEREALSECINNYLLENKEEIFAARNDPQVQAAMYQFRDKCKAIGANKESKANVIMNEFLQTQRDLNADTMQVILSQADHKTIGKARKSSRRLNRIGSKTLVSQLLNVEKRSLESFGIRTSREAIDFLNSLGPERANLTHLDLRDLKINPDELQVLLENLPKLKTLIINSETITDENIGAGLMHLKKLENLDLAGCTQLTAGGICSTLPHLPNLRGLDIRNIHLIDSDLPVLAPLLTNLTSLSIGCNVPDITNAGLQILAPCLGKLTSLHIEDCPRLTADALAPLAVLTGLTSLSLVQLHNITDASILALAPALAKLTSLNLESCTRLTGASIEGLAEVLIAEASKEDPAKVRNSLQSLSLVGFEGISETSWEKLAPALTELVSLNLNSCDISNKVMFAMALYIKKLQSLNLTWCPKLTNEGLLALAPALTTLRSLILANCKGLTPAAIYALAPSLRHLEELDLTNCPWVRDEVIRALAPVLTNLQNLVLGRCIELTDDGICALVPHVTQFRTLNLGNCPKITDVSLVALAPRLENATELNLNFCNITDTGIRAAAPYLSNLRELSLAYTGIGDEAMFALAPSLGHLRVLELSGCLKLTDAAIRQLVPYLAKLEIFDLAGCVNLRDGTLEALIPLLKSLTFLSLAGCTQMTEDAKREFISRSRRGFHLIT